jgi:hypothetical protein
MSKSDSPQTVTSDSLHHITVGSVFPLIAILAGVTVIFAIILLMIGDASYLPATGVLLGLLLLAAAGESLLARHQAGFGHIGGDGPLPVMAVELTDPFSMDGDLPEKIAPHDYPLGHPACRTLGHANRGDRA